MAKPSTPAARLALVAALVVLAATIAVRADVRLPAPGDRSVHDLGNVISPEDEAAMERWQADLFRKTGVAIVVITVPSLAGETIEDFAVRVGHEWGVGKKGQDRGIVVALAVAERRIFVATGYGVEGYLPDGRVGRILDTVAIPDSRRNDFSKALLRTSAVLVQASAAEFRVEIEGLAAAAAARAAPSKREKVIAALFGIIMLLFLGYMALRHPQILVLLLMSGSGRGGGRGGFRGGGFGGGRGGGGFGGFGGGGFGGGGAGRGF